MSSIPNIYMLLRKYIFQRYTSRSATCTCTSNRFYFKSHYFIISFLILWIFFVIFIENYILWLQSNTILTIKTINNNTNTSINLEKLLYKNHEDIVYLKTHKTASSTFNSILFRNFCYNIYSHEYNCFLPPTNLSGHIWDFSNRRDRIMIDNPLLRSNSNSSMRINVWLYHVKNLYNKNHVIFKTNKYLTTIRRPCYRFISAWKWYHLEQLLRVKLDEFINLPIWYRKFFYEMKLHYKSSLDATTKELLGEIPLFLFPWRRWRYEQQFQQLIQDITLSHLLLLVADRFDESLLVFSRLMQWNNKLIRLLYSQQKQSKKEFNISIQNTNLEKLDIIQSYDSMLYELANRMLDRYIIILFNDLNEFHIELKKLQQLQYKFHINCRHRYYNHNETNTFDYQYCDWIHQDNRDNIQQLREIKTMTTLNTLLYSFDRLSDDINKA